MSPPRAATAEPPHARPRLLAPLLLAAVLAAATVAAAVALHARGPQLELRVTRLPRGHDHRPVRLSPAHPGVIRFYIAESDPAADVEIVGPGQRTVRTLASGVPLPAHRRIQYAWDGRTDGGRPAPPGVYRLRVELPSRDRDMVWPFGIELRR